MYKKVSVILAIAFVVAANQISHSAIGGDLVHDLLDKLEVYVDSAVSKATEEIKIEKRRTEDTATDVLAVANSALQSLQNSFKREIDTIIMKAKKDGINIDDCLGKDLVDLMVLPSTSQQKVSDCVTTIVENVLTSINAASSQIDRGSQEVPILDAKIKACEKNHNTTCLGQIVETIELDMTKLPEGIENYVNKIVEKVEAEIPAINKCGIETINDCQSQGKVLVTKIRNCADQKRN